MHFYIALIPIIDVMVDVILTLNTPFLIKNRNNNRYETVILLGNSLYNVILLK